VIRYDYRHRRHRLLRRKTRKTSYMAHNIEQQDKGDRQKARELCSKAIVELFDIMTHLQSIRDKLASYDNDLQPMPEMQAADSRAKPVSDVPEPLSPARHYPGKIVIQQDPNVTSAVSKAVQALSKFSAADLAKLRLSLDTTVPKAEKGEEGAK